MIKQLASLWEIKLGFSSVPFDLVAQCHRKIASSLKCKTYVYGGQHIVFEGLHAPVLALDRSLAAMTP